MSSLLQRGRAALIASADPEHAAKMQAYMKSAMPYHGAHSTDVKRVMRELFADVSFASEAAYVREVRELWRGATHREERYLAIALTKHKKGGAKFREPTTLPLYEEMIVTGAWWDFVDDLAAHTVGDLVMAHRAPMSKTMRAWSRDPHLWKRRTSILHQLRYRGDIDLPLLEHCIEGSIDDKDFFARKAIGWALRQHAKTDAKWVDAYVKKNETRLSGLSKREAMKRRA
jgi:3-methyladenine DNA glycosylase AlkD